MPYSIKELYYTIQGEGAQSGRAAIFCRFAVAIYGVVAKPIARLRSAIL